MADYEKKLRRTIQYNQHYSEGTLSDDDFEFLVVEWFKIKTGVKQVCDISGLPFLLVFDWVIRHITRGKRRNNLRWKFNTKLVDLNFAEFKIR